MQRVLHLLLVTVGLFAFWVVLSGKLDAVHLVMGIVSAVLVAGVSAHQLFSHEAGGRRRWLTLIPWGRFLLYLPWLGWEIVKANMLVLRLVLGPRSRLAPRIVTFRTELTSELARVVLANSINLTPGTVTLDVTPDGTFSVHVIDEAAARGVLEGSMQRKVADTFREGRA